MTSIYLIYISHVINVPVFVLFFFLHLGLIFIVTSKSGVEELMLVNQAVQDTTAIEKNIQLLSFKLKGTE